MSVKNRKTLLAVLTVILVIMLSCAAFLIVHFIGKENRQEETVEANKQDLEHQILLDFESYEEVVGTHLSMYRALGQMTINKDKTYVASGEGSLKIQVQGDYNKPEEKPWVAFGCSDTTIATADFSKFESISLDVYNASQEQLHMNMALTFLSMASSDMLLPEEEFVLEAGQWTTCTFDLTEAYQVGLCDMGNAQKIKLSFGEHKKSRDDAQNILYVDKLVGHYFDTEPEVSGFDIYEMITFEDPSHEYRLMQVQDILETKVVSWAEEGMQVDSDMGEHGFKMMVPAGAGGKPVYPTLRLNSSEVLPAGTTLMLRAYVGLQEGANARLTAVGYTGSYVVTTERKLNGWMDIAVTLMKEMDYIEFWFALWDTDANMTIYLDNLEVTNDLAAVLSEEQKEFTLDPGIFNSTSIYLGELKKNELVQFDLSTSKAVEQALDSGKWFARLQLRENDTIISHTEIRKSGLLKSVQLLSDRITTNAYVIVRLFRTSDVGAVEYYNSGIVLKLMNYTTKIVQTQLTGSADFENANGAGYNFTAVNKVNGLQRVNYKSEKINAPTEMGAHGLAMDIGGSSANIEAEVKVSAGKTIKKGTVVRFKTYIKAPENYTGTIPDVRLRQGGKLPGGLPLNKWIDVALTVTEDSEVLNIYFIMKNGNTILKVYLDNFSFGTGCISGDGGLEKANGKEWIFETAQSIMNIERVSYKDSGITVRTGMGAHGLKLSIPNSGQEKLYPEMQFSTGTTIKAGTVLRFKAYIKTSNSFTGTCTGLVLRQGNNFKGGLPLNQWVNVALTVKEDTDIMNCFFVIKGATERFDIYVDEFKFGKCSLTSSADLEVLNGKAYQFDAVDYISNVDRISYKSAGIRAESNMGAYGLLIEVDGTSKVSIDAKVKLTTDAVVKAGTILQFKAYIKTVDSYAGTIPSVRLAQGSKLPGGMPTNQWFDLALVVTSDTKIMDIIFNMRNSTEDVEIYLDNFTFGLGRVTGDGSMEQEGVEDWTYEVSESILNMERIAYKDSTVTPASGLGTHGLKLTILDSGQNKRYPEVNLDVGKVVPAGSVLTFKAYIQTSENFTGVCTGIQMRQGNALKGQVLNQWINVALTVKEDTEVLSWYFIIKESTGHVDIYLDDFKLGMSGLAANADMETEQGDDYQFNIVKNVAVLNRVSYKDSGITADSSLGSYGLKLDVSGSTETQFNAWINVTGKESVKAGTVVRFKAYIKTPTDYAGTCKDIRLVDGGTVTDTLPFNRWIDVALPLNVDKEAVGIYFIMKDSTENIEIYLDNFSFGTGRVSGDASLELTNGTGWQFNAVQELHQLERVSYADSGITADSSLGSYGLKLSVIQGCQEKIYPQWSVSTGEKIHTGSILRFKIYIKTSENYTGTCSGLSFGQGASAGSIPMNQWKEITLTTTKDATTLDCWLVMKNSTEAFEIYVDDFVLIRNSLSVAADVEAASGDAIRFSGKTAIANMNRVSYSSYGVTVDEESGSYGLLLSLDQSKFTASGQNKRAELTISTGQTIKAGSVLRFRIYVKTSEEINFREIGLDQNGKMPAGNDGFWLNRWVDVALSVNTDTESLGLYFLMRNVTDNFEVYLDNFSFGTGSVTVQGDMEQSTDSSWTISTVQSVASVGNIAYEDAGLNVETGLGKKGLQLSVVPGYINTPTGTFKTIYPEIKLTDKKAKKGQKLRFKCYVETTGSDPGYCRRIGLTGGTSQNLTTEDMNKWVDIELTLNEDKDDLNLIFYINNNAECVNIYLDNITLN